MQQSQITSSHQPVTADQVSLTNPLPLWEQLLPEQRHELIIALAATLVKRLPLSHHERKEVKDE